MKAVAARQKLTLPADLSVDAEVDLGPVGEVFGIAVRMKTQPARHGQGLRAQQLVDRRLTRSSPLTPTPRGNIDVTLTIA